MIEAYRRIAPVSKRTWGSLIPMPRGPARVGIRQKSESANLLRALPVLSYIGPARFTIWTTFFALAARPMSGGEQRRGFGFPPGVPAKDLTMRRLLGPLASRATCFAGRFTP